MLDENTSTPHGSNAFKVKASFIGTKPQILPSPLVKAVLPLTALLSISLISRLANGLLLASTAFIHKITAGNGASQFHHEK